MWAHFRVEELVKKGFQKGTSAQVGKKKGVRKIKMLKLQ